MGAQSRNLKESGLAKGGAQWLRSSFTEWTPDGHLCDSRFAGLRDGKDAFLIVRG